MGRWVTTSQGRRLYIPDEGEENPYTKQIDKEISDKERQIAANKAQATQKNREDFMTTPAEDKAYERRQQLKKEAEEKKKLGEIRAIKEIPVGASYQDIQNTLNRLGLSKEFQKKLGLKGSSWKPYDVIARRLIAEAVQKGKI